MKRFVLISALLLIFLFLCSCTQVGAADCGIFTDRFNEVSKELQIDEKKLAVSQSGDNLKYYYFFDNNSGGEYMITIYTDKDTNELTKCTLCTLSVTDTDTQKVKALFTSMAYAYDKIGADTVNSIFEKLKLSDKSTYTADSNVEEEFGDYTVSLTVDSAGTAITLA